jgi:putative transposase
VGETSDIIDFHLKNPLEGYRRVTFMMLDADVVAVSPATVWRVLMQAGLLSRWKAKPSRKGTGFEQPLRPHQHWHIDVSYLNVCGTFYHFCRLSGWIQSLYRALGRAGVDEGGRYRGNPRTSQGEVGEVPGSEATNYLRQRAAVHRSRLQGVYSNLWHDACPNLSLLSPIERENRALDKSLKSECIRPGTPLSLDDALRLVQGYVEHYNHVRLNSAIGYITPKDMLAGRQQEIQVDRDRKLEAATEHRKNRRRQRAA